MDTRAQTLFGLAMSVLLLGALAMVARINARATIEMETTSVSRCVNRVCPITGYQLADEALAVEYQGQMVGVRDEEAARAWDKLPETQQRDIFVDIVLPAHR